MTTDTPLKLRACVDRFAALMETTLRENDHKLGWQDMTPSELFYSLTEEVTELAKALMDRGNDDIIKEATDVANFAMMIVDTLKDSKH